MYVAPVCLSWVSTKADLPELCSQQNASPLTTGLHAHHIKCPVPPLKVLAAPDVLCPPYNHSQSAGSSASLQSGVKPLLPQIRLLLLLGHAHSVHLYCFAQEGTISSLK